MAKNIIESIIADIAKWLAEVNILSYILISFILSINALD